MNERKKSLVITSIANDQHPVLKQFARECTERKIDFIMIGDLKSPATFDIPGCDFWSVEKQHSSPFQKFSKLLPTKHYARKNLGYVSAIANGTEVILETDDDNIPYESFWKVGEKTQQVHTINNGGWVNIYKYFSKELIWPRGLPLERIKDNINHPMQVVDIICPIQQGLADDNPDVDAVFRLVLPLPLKFDQNHPIALGAGSWCPFNSQNTIWHKEAFPLLYLPSYCSFRMTDIWRSYVAQRIATANGWHILFYAPTVYQERNDHSLLRDFEDEVPGYMNNDIIKGLLEQCDVKGGAENMTADLFTCYKSLVDAKLIGELELPILEEWIRFFEDLKK